MVVEVRHTAGMMYDDDSKLIPVIDEMRMISEVVDEVKAEHPHFVARIILTGLRLIGRRHVEKMFT
jgi:hypothetical protein